MPDESFYALHVSGGTTELLYCEPAEETFFTAQLISGALDLHGGQFVDRIGVALDLPFPAGPHMERIAKTLCDDPKALKKTVNRLESESNGDFKMLPVSVKTAPSALAALAVKPCAVLNELTTDISFPMITRRKRL